MKSKVKKVDAGIKRLEVLKGETILRFADEINFDSDVSLYDAMIEHLVKGDLDDAFMTDVTNDMSPSEKKSLFRLVRNYYDLCFIKGDSEYWIDSLEDTPIFDFDLIAYSILDSFNFLLNIAKKGGKEVLDKIEALRNCSDLQDAAIINYLRNSFVNDEVLTTVLLDASKKDSFYNLFTDDQLGNLFILPEGTVYYYSDENEVKLVSPLVLGLEIYNRANLEQIDLENTDDLEAVAIDLKTFFAKGDFDFQLQVLNLSDRYRDYFRKNNVTIGDEVKIVSDSDGSMIRKAWQSGDAFLGGMIDSPYVAVNK